MITLIVTMLIPPDPKNAWLFGFSQNRLFIAGSLLVALALFSGLSIKAWRDDAWLLKIAVKLKTLVDEFGLFLPIIWGLFTLIYFSPYAYLMSRPDLHPVIGRIAPVAVLGFLLSIQTLILILIFRRDLIAPTSWNKQENFNLKIKPLKVAAIFGIISFLLIFISVSFNLIDNIIEDNYLIHFTVKMYIDKEQNVPTYFSSLMLFVVATLFGAIAILKDKEDASYVAHWIILALIFAFFSIDEVTGIHEMLSRPVRRWVNPQGIFSFAWVVIGIPFVLFFALSYLRFFLHLPKRYKWLFVFSAVCYIGGALGFELIGAGYTNVFGWDSLYDFIASIEETLEMTGLVVMIYALLAYIAEYYDQTRFVLQRVDKSRDH